AASCRIFSGLVRTRRDRMADTSRHRMADRHRRFGASLPMRMTASWFRSLDLPHTRLWRDSTAPESGLPSDCHPDCIIVLEAVRMRLARSNQETDAGKNASPCLTQKAPYKGRCVDSVEKHEPASDIGTAAADSLIALDPNRPIRAPCHGQTF